MEVAVATEEVDVEKVRPVGGRVFVRQLRGPTRWGSLLLPGGKRRKEAGLTRAEGFVPLGEVLAVAEDYGGGARVGEYVVVREGGVAIKEGYVLYLGTDILGVVENVEDVGR